MKRILYIITVLAAICLTVSCSDEKRPGQVVLDSMNCLKDGDIHGYLSTYNLSPSDKEFFEDIYEEKGEATISEKGGIKSVKIASEDVEEDVAHVAALVSYGNGSVERQEFTLRKINGEWLQEFNK